MLVRQAYVLATALSNLPLIKKIPLQVAILAKDIYSGGVGAGWRCNRIPAPDGTDTPTHFSWLHICASKFIPAPDEKSCLAYKKACKLQ